MVDLQPVSSRSLIILVDGKKCFCEDEVIFAGGQTLRAYRAYACRARRTVKRSWPACAALNSWDHAIYRIEHDRLAWALIISTGIVFVLIGPWAGVLVLAFTLIRLCWSVD